MNQTDHLTDAEARRRAHNDRVLAMLRRARPVPPTPPTPPTPPAAPPAVAPVPAYPDPLPRGRLVTTCDPHYPGGWRVSVTR